MREYMRADGFDFRAVPLDPSLIGSERLCVVGSVDPTGVRCESDRHDTQIALESGELVPHEYDVLRVRIDSASHFTLIAKVGAIRRPPPPSRCDCGPRFDPRAPKPPHGDDWSRAAPSGATRRCQVYGVGTPQAASASGFDPSVATFAEDVACSGKDVWVGALSYQTLLELHEGDVIELEVYGSRALYRGMPYRYESGDY